MLKVLTLNLNYYGARHGAWEARRALICEAIRAEEPDVVALQAVRREPEVEDGLDQARQLARDLEGYGHAYFQPAVENGGGIAEGSAILSRIPFAETDCLALTLRAGIEDTNHRVLQRARFDLPSGSLQLFNGHFSWVLPQARDNLAEALPYMLSFAGPRLLVGDMNTMPNSDLWEPLLDAGWQDAWAGLQGDAEGFTFESDRLFMRIDYAWTSPELAGQIDDVAVVQRERDGVRMSDHLGLAVTLSL